MSKDTRDKGAAPHKIPQTLAADMGKRIRRARKDAALTQSELADEVNRRQASISAIENGKMTVDADTLARLALSLDKPIGYFFPDWLASMLHPEELSPSESELLSLFRMLDEEEMRMFIIQIRAIAARGESR
jgi:transcriptional regulator with XRE-family HTH domain